MEKVKEIEDLVLVTLSFYEPMSFSQIVFDMDSEVLKSLPEFDRDKLFLVLNSLEKRGLVRKTGEGAEVQWQRIHKKRSFWGRFFSK